MGRPRKTSRTDPTQSAYNGYSDADRGKSSAWAKKHAHIKPRRVPRETPCAVCNQIGGQIGWHSEDYHAPLDSFAVCGWCHWALHSRFKSYNVWPRWKRMLADGMVPPLCEWGTRWPTFAARYVRGRDWDWTPSPLDYWMSPFADLLLDTYTMEPAPGLNVSMGDPHLPNQWNSGGLYLPRDYFEADTLFG